MTLLSSIKMSFCENHQSISPSAKSKIFQSILVKNKLNCLFNSLLFQYDSSKHGIVGGDVEDVLKDGRIESVINGLWNRMVKPK
jgi:hypothetical protein